MFDPEELFVHLKNFSVYQTAVVALKGVGDQPPALEQEGTDQEFFEALAQRSEAWFLQGMDWLDTLAEKQGIESGQLPTDGQLEELGAMLRRQNPCLENIEGLVQSFYALGLEWRRIHKIYRDRVDDAPEAQQQKSRSAPRGLPKELFSVHSSSPVYDIGETIARGIFKLEENALFPSADIVGATQGRLELLPFWDHTNNVPITPQSISLAAKGGASEFSRMQEEAVRIASSYNEEMATYFYAMDAYWLTHAKNPDDYVELQISDLLQYSGKKPVKTHGRYTGTYRADQLQRAGMMVYGMGFSMVEIERATIKGVGERSHYKRLWDVTDIYVMETLDKERYIESMTYRPNEFFRTSSFGSRRETALLMGKVLGLDYDKMVVARRLGRYYTWLWRDRAHSGDIAAPISCERLLDRASIEVAPGKERYARRSLENALDRLEAEGIIAQWVLLDEGGSPADTAVRIPFSRWRQMKISVSPPDTIVLHYAAGIEPKPEEPPGALDIALLRATRQKLGYTLAMLSEETGVELSTLSRIEAGKTKRPRAEHLKKLQKWLEKNATKG